MQRERLTLALTQIRDALSGLLKELESDTECGVLSFGAYRLDTLGRCLTKSGRPVRLTTLEFDLLWHLAERPGEAIARRELESDVCGLTGETRAVHTHICQLRKKAGLAKHITTIHGYGYKLTP